MASTLSLSDTGRPTCRSSAISPSTAVSILLTHPLPHRRSPAGMTRAASRTEPCRSCDEAIELRGRELDIVLVLQQDVQVVGEDAALDQSAPRISSVRAQSMVSDTDGGFFSSSLRSDRTT